MVKMGDIQISLIDNEYIKWNCLKEDWWYPFEYGINPNELYITKNLIGKWKKSLDKGMKDKDLEKYMIEYITKTYNKKNNFKILFFNNIEEKIKSLK